MPTTLFTRRVRLSRRLLPGLLAVWLAATVWSSTPAHALSPVTRIYVGTSPQGSR